MYDVILQTGALILIGVLWRIFTPMGLEAEPVRRSLTGVVYMVLLPALVLVVLWRAPLDLDAVRVALAAMVGVFTGLAGAMLWFRWRPAAPAAVGALVLASAFPNATYMGLPVLEATLGPWSRSVAIQYDLFACTPLLLSLGVMMAASYGGTRAQGHPLLALLRVPPLIAAVIGVLLNLAEVPLPQVVADWLDMLGAGVIPLMLFSLGLGLQWGGGWWERLPLVLPVLAISLVVNPLLVWGAARGLGLEGDVLTAVVLEAAMPSMVLGIVLCDRYRLDTGLYAMAVTLTTALSLITLPAWFDLLSL